MPREIHQLAKNLFRYLRELVGLRTTKIRDLGRYRSHIWLSDIPTGDPLFPECSTAAGFIAGDDTDEAQEPTTWLRIRRPDKPLVSQPIGCDGWFDASALEDDSTEPALFPEVFDQPYEVAPGDDIENAVARPRRLVDHPEVVAAWRHYLETSWHPWRVKFDRWKRVHDLYSKLFEIWNENERRPEEYELLLGIGVVTGRHPEGENIRRPLIVARAEIAFDTQSSELRVVPSAEGPQYALEYDFLNGILPPAGILTEVERDAAAISSIWRRTALLPVLRTFFESLPPEVNHMTVSESLECPSLNADLMQLAISPVVIFRRRKMRALMETLKALEDHFGEQSAIPDILRQILGGQDRDGNLANEPSLSSALSDSEVLFPLVSNDEQDRIIHRLGNRPGILVKGPPGTGKSHTIVNLIGHFLALGMRVLVTSQTRRALEVLQQKIQDDAPELLPLTVSLLGEDATSRQSMDQAVDGILERLDDFDEEGIEQRVQNAEAQRHRLQSKLEELRTAQRNFRQSDFRSSGVPGTKYEGTVQSIGERLSSERGRFQWFTDDADPLQDPPLNAEELDELCLLYDNHKDNLEEVLNLQLPGIEDLPNAECFATACQALRMSKQSFDSLDHDGGSAISQAMSCLPADELDNLADAVHAAARLSPRIRGSSVEWADAVVRDLVWGIDEHWLSLQALMIESLSKIDVGPNAGCNAEFHCPVEVRLDQQLADATSLLSFFHSGRTLRFAFFRGGSIRRLSYLWKKCRFDGYRCDTQETVEALVRHLTTLSLLEGIEHEWKGICAAAQGTVRERVATYRTWAEVLNQAIDIGKKLASTLHHSSELDTVLTDTEVSVDYLAQLHREVRDAKILHSHRTAQEELKRLTTQIRQKAAASSQHPVLHQLIDTIQPTINAEKYSRSLLELADLRDKKRSAVRCQELDHRLRRAMPILADQLANDETRAQLRPSLADVSAAREWKIASNWIQQAACPTEQQNAEDISSTEASLRRATAELIAAKAWQNTVLALNADPQLREYMMAWKYAGEDVGGGTGDHAETFRRQAREYLLHSRRGIPVWIMPMHRVAEQIAFDGPQFDVLIVDEASQIGPEGLFLPCLANQSIIVGDEEQISPDVVGVRTADVLSLMQQHLEGVPFGERLLPTRSLFSFLRIHFRKQVTLREHFRCVPEIIRFSNQLCYRNSLVLLRRYASDRLVPIQTRHVIDGYRRGRGANVVNEPEAAAVAVQLARCLRDPRYHGKSFGVICLQGKAQAQLIQQMVLEYVGPDPFKDDATRLRCGDAYDFQGDERDVVFLSLVAASSGDARNAPLTRKTFRQRFNVAASRARDQMWLFHSVTVAELNPNCMRRRLLEYCLRPPATQHSGVDVESLRRAAADPHSRIGNAPEPFDSWFEVDVFLVLVDQGYDVIPQFEVAGRRIDLVVNDAVAVECDGDAFHGIDEYDQDMARQRMLERCGWPFVRIRGSEFYGARERAIEKLFADLAARKVMPATSHSSSSDPTAESQAISGADCLIELGRRVAESRPSAGDNDEHVDSREMSKEDLGLEDAPQQVRHEEAPVAETFHDDRMNGNVAAPDHAPLTPDATETFNVLRNASDAIGAVLLSVQTGWPPGRCRAALDELCERGLVDVVQIGRQSRFRPRE